ncbi:MAG TPA: glycoside hydrolase N-terminal domain-containing protein [Armatimonadota bacterium]
MTARMLWYDAPAGEDWNRALPIGAGRLGAMIFGNVFDERIQLNEDTVWNGGPRDRNNPDALANLPRLRELLFAGKLAEAHALANDVLCGVPDIMRNYEPLGDILLTIEHAVPAVTGSHTWVDETGITRFIDEKAQPEGYRRTLNLDTATADVRYTLGGVTYMREYLASNVDQVIAVRITADKPGAISFRARLERGPRDNYASRYADTLTPEDGCALVVEGATAGAQGVGFAMALRGSVDGGSIRTLGETLIIEGANAVTLVLAAATTFREADPAAYSRAHAKTALAQDWSALRAAHVAEFQGFFQRVDLTLTPSDPSLAALPTDARLARVSAGQDDPELIALYFHYGRYLLISASRLGSIAANLQGIWNQDFSPAWGSKYTININIQMNYWPAEVCNLPEIHEPLFAMVEGLRAPGRVTARKMYDCGGFVCHHNTDLWSDTSPVDRNLAASYWPMGGAWLSLHLWEHYAFTGDKAFLGTAYETLKEASQFFLDFLVEDAKGRLVTCPASSPENTYLLPNGERGTLCIGASMDNQILDKLFRATRDAAEILDRDDAFRAQVESARVRLPQPSIGKYGQIMEWPEDYEEPELGHRHISHLFALYPSDQISPRRTPELAQAARTTLERRLSHGGGGTGWSRAWIINFWARLLDADKAYANLQALLGLSTLPNMFDNHPPFQIDGNFGGTSGIAEMLLQSAHDEIELLPALPAAWPQGAVRGFCARGGFQLDFTWADGALTGITVHSRLGGPCALRYRDTVVTLDTAPGSTVQLDGQLK